MFLNFTQKELAKDLANNLEPLIERQVEKLLDRKSEDEERPSSMSEASDFLDLSRTTFSKLVGKGEIPYKSLNPENPKAKKLFLKKDLRQWILNNRSKTVQELKNASYGKS